MTLDGKRLSGRPVPANRNQPSCRSGSPIVTCLPWRAPLTDQGVPDMRTAENESGMRPGRRRGSQTQHRQKPRQRDDRHQSPESAGQQHRERGRGMDQRRAVHVASGRAGAGASGLCAESDAAPVAAAGTRAAVAWGMGGVAPRSVPVMARAGPAKQASVLPDSRAVLHRGQGARVFKQMN